MKKANTNWIYRAARLPILSALAIVAGSMAVACGFPKTVDGPPPRITVQQVEHEAQAGSGVTQAYLDTGRDLFAAKCNGCHGYPDIATVADDKWPAIMTRMGKKSDLNADQSQQVLAFVRAAKAK